MYKGIVFDIGQTLVEYSKPLNWSKFYRPAMEKVAADCGYDLSAEDYSHALAVLAKYNTRTHPRTYEVPSAVIFAEILSGIHQPAAGVERAKQSFYAYFRSEAALFPEVEATLRELTSRKITLGTLSDVAYGMDNEYALADISGIQKYLAYPCTSNDSGFRKPCPDGLLLLAQRMGLNVSEVMMVGDEEKDVLCAKNAGAYSVLINRERHGKHYGQDAEIHSLTELLNLLD